MRADKVLKAILAKDGKKAREITEHMGRSPRYLDQTIYRGNVPKTGTFSEILDACGYDLIARSRDDGFEFLITPE